MLEDPDAAELHHTQYFEMMGSRSIYHDGWKATTNHISTGVLDEEELAVGSRNFDEDRWELFDLSADFSESTDRADDEPERLQRMRDLWDAEARRNNVLPISDGLVDRFGGLHPAGLARRAARGPSAPAAARSPTSRSRCCGAASTSRPTSTPTATGPTGVVFALGDWFGGYALYLVDGRAHFTFARAADALELATPSALAAGRHEVSVSYAVGEGGAAGRMVLLRRRGRGRRDGRRGDAAPGRSSTAARGCASDWDSGFPVSPPLHAAGALQRDGARGPDRHPGLAAARPGRRGPRRAARRLTHGGRGISLSADRGAGVRQVLTMRGAPAPPPARRSGRCGRRRVRTGALRSSSSSLSARNTASRRAPLSSRSAHGLGRRDRRPARTACAALAWSISVGGVGDAVAPAIASSQRRPFPWPSAMWWRTTPTGHPSPGTGRTHASVGARSGEGHRLRVRRGEVVRQRRRPLTRRGAPPPARSAPRCATPRAAAPSAAAAEARRCSRRSPASARRGGRPAARSRR